jgi:nucleoside-diphosphate-sugar epimerase
MKKVLLAGGAGYIGTMLTEELISRNYDVTVVDLLWFGNYLPTEAKLLNKNIMDLQEEDLRNFEVVVFQAGLSNDPMADYSPSMNFVENAAVPAYLAFIAKRAGVQRFVYASSCSIYGYTANNLMDETAPVSPQYPYGISKLSAEYTIMSLEDEKFKPISLRKGTVGGYSPRMRFDLVVNAMTKSALKDGKITVNNPSLWRPLIDVRDVVMAYVRSIESNSSVSGVYNISYDNYTIGRLADEIREELSRHGKSPSIITKNVQDVRNYKVTNNKAKIELDFVPRYSPKDSVREILRNIDLSSVDYDDKKYYNIATFKEVL